MASFFEAFAPSGVGRDGGFACGDGHLADDEWLRSLKRKALVARRDVRETWGVTSVPDRGHRGAPAPAFSGCSAAHRSARQVARAPRRRQDPQGPVQAASRRRRLVPCLALASAATMCRRRSGCHSGVAHGKLPGQDEDGARTAPTPRACRPGPFDFLVMSVVRSYSPPSAPRSPRVYSREQVVSCAPASASIHHRGA